MKLETFFEKFDQFAEAPDAVAKMRALILRLAMQGKLSEPHRTDDSVGDLLREVEKDKTRLGLKISVNAANGNSDFSKNETADVIPPRWSWVRFGSIARHNAGKTLDKGRNRGELRDYITTSNLYWGFFQLDSVRQMPMLDDELERCTAIKGDLLICEGGEAGRAAVWPHDREISFQNHVHRARFFAGINPYFVQRYLEKLNATGEIEKYRRGVGISNMSGKALASIPIPLPPLAEQNRIVTKVDELMALCDRLEAQQEERETRHLALARASLARFADAATTANLQFLFHKSFDISPADLRKSILTLAVQGKLVPQDPNDEPASNLLERIAIAFREKKKLESLPPVAPSEESFEIPESWEWCRFGELGQIGSSCRIHQREWTSSGIPFLRAREIVKLSKYGKVDNQLFISEERFHQLSKDGLIPEPNDLLITGVGTIGVSYVVRNGDRFYFKDASVLIFKNWFHLYPLYLNLVLQSPYWFKEIYKQSMGTTVHTLTIIRAKSTPIPLPPEAEQRRIVDNVEKLMTLVEALETQLAASRSTAVNLLTALVAELTTANKQ